MTHTSLEGKITNILHLTSDEQKVQHLIVLIREREQLAREYQEQYQSRQYRERVQQNKQMV